MHTAKARFLQRYSRQIVMPEIGVTGQRILSNSTVLIAGCGGIGSVVIPMLAASGIGKIVLYDDDTVKISNLSRQIIYKEGDLGCKKVLAAEKFIRELNRDVDITVVDSALGPENFVEAISAVDIVVDCVDRLAIKAFLNDACVVMSKVLVHCVSIGFTGEVMTILPGRGPCYRCFFEEGRLGEGLNCASSGVLCPTVGIIGSFASSEVIKHLTGCKSSSKGKLYRIDLYNNSFGVYEFEKNVNCKSCGHTQDVDPNEREGYIKEFTKRRVY